VERARRHGGQPARAVHPRHLPAARAAERLREALRLGDLVRRDELLAAEPAQAREVLDEDVRRVRRGASAPTTRAVAVHDRARDPPGDLVRDAAAEAASAY